MHNSAQRRVTALHRRTPRLLATFLLAAAMTAAAPAWWVVSLGFGISSFALVVYQVPSRALRQRVTPRYIHKLFESEGTTLSRFILGQRLVHVHRMLTDPRHAGSAISALAYTAGFGDLSTFNREFRRHYGKTPSDVRAAWRLEPPSPSR